MYALVDSIALAVGLDGAQTFEGNDDLLEGFTYIPDQHQNDWSH